MDPEFCPVCAKFGRVSKVECFIHDEVNVILCERNNCPFSYHGEHIVRKREDSHVPKRILTQFCSKLCPITIMKEPKLKYRHMKMLFWLSHLQKCNIYYWFREEVASMVYSKLYHGKDHKGRYQLTPWTEQMMNLTDEEIQVGKHIIPDLRRIASVLKLKYQLYLNS